MSTKKVSHRRKNSLKSIPTWIWVVAFLLVLSAHSYRLFTRIHEPGINDVQTRGFVDFHNAIYFPVNSFLSGGNPYSRQYAESHPDGRSFPLFPPHSLILHAPLSMWPIDHARYVYFGFELLVFGLLTCWILTMVNVKVGIREFLMLGTFIMLTVPCYSQLYLGQLTFQLVLASLVAVYHSRTRPWLAGVALSIAACKPQFAIPIALLLLCRKDWKTVLIGGAIASTLSLIGIFVIGSNVGFTEFFTELQANYFSLNSHPELGNPAENYRRIDFYPLIVRMTDGGLPNWQKLAVTFGCLMTGGMGVCALRKYPSFDPVSNLLICLTTLGCIYHSHYDLLLLVLPLVSIWLGHPKIWRKLPAWFRWTMFAILLALVWNAFHLTRIQEAFGLDADQSDMRWRIATSLSSLAIVVGIVLCTGMSFIISKKVASVTQSMAKTRAP